MVVILSFAVVLYGEYAVVGVLMCLRCSRQPAALSGHSTQQHLPSSAASVELVKVFQLLSAHVLCVAAAQGCP
jgi:hypothetical protein